MKLSIDLEIFILIFSLSYLAKDEQKFKKMIFSFVNNQKRYSIVVPMVADPTK